MLGHRTVLCGIVLVALVELAALSIAGCGCGAVGCQHYFEVARTFTAPLNDTLDAEVTACRNGRCSQGTFAIAGARPFDSVERALAGDANVRVLLMAPEPGKPWRITASFSADGIEEGDSILVTVVETSFDRELLRVDGRLTVHTERPNGAFCSPTCDVAELNG